MTTKPALLMCYTCDISHRRIVFLSKVETNLHHSSHQDQIEYFIQPYCSRYIVSYEFHFVMIMYTAFALFHSPKKFVFHVRQDCCFLNVS